jgi:hypothetical protein
MVSENQAVGHRGLQLGLPRRCGRYISIQSIDFMAIVSAKRPQQEPSWVKAVPVEAGVAELCPRDHDGAGQVLGAIPPSTKKCDTTSASQVI